MTITIEQVAKIMPHLPPAKLAVYFPHLYAAMLECDILSPIREAAFLSQLALESGELRWMEEFADGHAYEGRKDLGNTHPGDGKLYKGRGPIQLTGRANYKAAGDALGVDLVNHPLLAATPEVAFRTATWYWKSHGLNAIADSILLFKNANEQAAHFDLITKRINGGLNGKKLRDMYFAHAREVLGC